jgi:hypothetical protein
VDINHCILDVVALTRNEVLKHRISLQTDLATVLPSIETDRVQLQQVVVTTANPKWLTVTRETVDSHRDGRPFQADLVGRGRIIAIASIVASRSPRPSTSA